jgi:hypothetical protein
MTTEIIVFAVLALSALGIVLFVSRTDNGPPSDAMSDAPVEAEVNRYREALRAETLCSRCGQANPPASRFCYECGKRLPAADNEEFEGTGEAA